jgi:N utilization substance protein A
LEVPEIGEGLIEIKGAARDPGSRAKIAVKSLDPKIDPVGACVGIRGSRVQSASNEINGERVDIITWSEEPAQFVIEAIKPAEVDSILVDEENHSMDIVVDESQLSQSIGKGGQNVRLASVLTGWELNIMTEAEATEKLELSAQNLSQRLMEELDIDEDISSILVQEGFSSLEEVAYVPRQELVDIEEFTEELVDELRKRAEDTLLAKAISEQQKLLPAEDLLNMEEVSDELAAKLAANGIRSMEDLAECAVDELLEIEGLGLESEKASVLIMAARAPWFEEADNQDS